MLTRDVKQERESLTITRNQPTVYGNRLPQRDFCTDRNLFGMNSRNTNVQKRSMQHLDHIQRGQDQVNIDRNIFNVDTSRDVMHNTQDKIGSRNFDPALFNFSRKNKGTSMVKTRMDPAISHFKEQKKTSSSGNEKYEREKDSNRFFNQKFDITKTVNEPGPRVKSEFQIQSNKFNPNIRY